MRGSLIAILLLIAKGCAWAQPFCEVRTFTIHDGLSATNLSGIKQTPDDLMWFSTWNGLYSYDGYQFSTFRNTPGENEVLSNNRLLLIAPDVVGNLWCTSYDRLLYLFDTSDCQFIDVAAMIQKKTGESYRTWHIFALPSGHTWVASEESDKVFRIDAATVREQGGDAITQYQLKGKLQTIEADSTGREWVLTSEGLWKCDASGKLQNMGNTPFDKCCEVGGSVFVATSDNRLAEIRPGQQKPEPVALPAGIARINALKQGFGPTLLAATDRGLLSYDVNTRKCQLLSVQSPAQPSPEVKAFFTDSHHRVWLFTDSPGITMIDSLGQHHQLQATASSPQLRTQSRTPLFHVDGYGTVWTVPNGGTFCYYDEQQGRLIPHVLRSVNTTDNLVPLIVRSFSDRIGNLWISGTRNVSLLNFRYRHFHFTPTVTNSETRSLLLDSRQRLWVGMKTGEILIYEKGSDQPKYLSPGGTMQTQPTVFGENIYALSEDRQGRIWIGTKVTGLYMLTPAGQVHHFMHDDNDPYSLSYNDAYDIDTDAQGHIWIATYRGGLNLVDESSGKIRFINSYNELKQYPMREGMEKIRRITHTQKGDIFVSTNYGLLTFSNKFRKPADIQFHENHHKIEDPSGLLANDVLQVLTVKGHRTFVVTLGGGVQDIVSSDLQQDHIRFSNIEVIEPHESVVQSVETDDRGNLWMIRENAITRFDINTETAYEYGESKLGEGIVFSEAKPIHDSISGNVYVAVNGGFITFNADELKRDSYTPNIVFTKLRYQGSDQQVPILNKKCIELPSDRRTITVYFSTLDYNNSDYIKYSYMIEGVDPSWNYIGTAHFAMLNNLPAGEHRLMVRSTNSEGIWMNNITDLTIYVEPTFEETVWYKMLCILAGLIVLAGAFFLGRKLAPKK